jgi:lipoate-protein ligase A
MAYQMNIPLMLEVLRIGQEKLSDKGIKSAEKRVGPLRQQTELPRETIIETMVDFFRDRHGLTPGALTPEEIAEAKTLAHDRFATREWVYFLP